MSSKSARQSAIEAITTYKPEAAPLNFVDTKPTDIFGCNVFNDRVMRERLPKSVYKALRKTIARFQNRFSHIEDRLHATGRHLQDASLDEMEALWVEAKSRENTQ